MRFAAFIMTYERPAIIGDTIRALLGQMFPPEKILVVDNSTSRETEKVIASLNDSRLEYYRVGHNAGPAGAARIGLERLVSQGYDWIHWADDDDPVKFSDAFALLLKHVNDRIGVIGAVGSLFDWRTGLRRRYKDYELKGLLPVDSIGGGYCMIINAKAVNTKTLPDDRLFFGLEEFDFCQRVKAEGYEICVLGELLYRYREINNKLGVDKKPSLVSKRKFEHLHREYYSYRNAIFLMSYTYEKPMLAARYTARALGKMLFSFVKGPAFGFRTTRLMFQAILDGYRGRMGKRV